MVFAVLIIFLSRKWTPGRLPEEVAVRLSACDHRNHGIACPVSTVTRRMQRSGSSFLRADSLPFSRCRHGLCCRASLQERIDHARRMPVAAHDRAPSGGDGNGSIPIPTASPTPSGMCRWQSLPTNADPYPPAKGHSAWRCGVGWIRRNGYLSSMNTLAREYVVVAGFRPSGLGGHEVESRMPSWMHRPGSCPYWPHPGHKVCNVGPAGRSGPGEKGGVSGSGLVLCPGGHTINAPVQMNA